MRAADPQLARCDQLRTDWMTGIQFYLTERPDTVAPDVEVAEARISRSRPDTGIVTFKAVARNAAGEALCDWVSPIIVRRRDATPPEQAR